MTIHSEIIAQKTLQHKSRGCAILPGRKKTKLFCESERRLTHKTILLRKKVFVLKSLDKYTSVYDVILAQNSSEEAFFSLRNNLVFLKDFGMNSLGMSWLLMKSEIIAKANRENDTSCVLQKRNTAGCKGRVLFLSWHFQHSFASKGLGRT